MSNKLEVAIVGVAIAGAGVIFVVRSASIARAYNAIYAQLPGRRSFASWWPRAFGTALFAFGLLLAVVALTLVH